MAAACRSDRQERAEQLTPRSNRLSRDGFDKIVASFGLAMKAEDADGYYALMQIVDDEVREVEALPDYVDPRLQPSAAVPLSGRKYYAPDKKDNPLNAWSHRVGSVTQLSRINLSPPPS